MSDMNQPAVPPPPPTFEAVTRPREPWPSWKHTLIMLVGGFLLAISSCFGFLFTLDFGGGGSSKTDSLNVVLAILFGFSILAFLIGIVMLLMKVTRYLFASGSRKS